MAGIAAGLAVAPKRIAQANDDVLGGRVVLDVEHSRPTISNQFGIFFEEVMPTQLSRYLGGAAAYGQRLSYCSRRQQPAIFADGHSPS